MQPRLQPSGVPRHATTASERLGAVLSGWRLDAVLGESPTNTVYAVSDRLGQVAALRLMHSETRGDPGVRRRAFREASTIRGLAHPGTAAILLADVATGGEPYVVMERLWGLDSRRFVEQLGAPVDPRCALAVAVQVSDVLVAAHTRSVVHRNVKSVTVFCGADGGVRLLDFGAALLPSDTGDQSLETLGVADLAWQAPELRDGRFLGDARADVFGLGCVLVGLLVGPDAGPPTDPDVVTHQLGDAITRLGRLPIGLQTDVADTLRRTFVWEPEQRLPDMRQVHERLREHLERLELRDPAAWREVVAAAVAPVAPVRDEGTKDRAFLSYELLRTIFERVERALYQARRTHWHDPDTEARVQDVLRTILESVRADASGLTFQIRPNAIELLGRPVWEPRAPFDAIPYRLFDAGFRKIRLLPSLDEDECRRFLRWLVTDPDTDLGDEDDLATLYWRQAFQSVRCDLVSSVVLQDLDEYDVLDRELQAIQSDAVREIRSALASHFARSDVDLDELDGDDGQEQLLKIVVRQATGLVDAPTQARLVELLAATPPHQPVRLAELLVRVLEEKPDERPSAIAVPFGTYVAEQLDEGRPGDALEVFASLRRQLADRERAQEFAAAFQSLRAMRTVLADALPAPGQGALSRATAASVHALLEASGPEVFDAVAAELSVATDDLSVAVLERYVARYANGRGLVLLPLLEAASVPGGVAILRAAWAMSDDGAIQATQAALGNPHPDVRLDAFARLAAGAPEVAGRAFAELVNDADPAVRRASIRIAVQAKLTLAMPSLQRRAASDAFNTLPLAERQQVYVAMLDLGGARAEEQLAALLLEEGAFSNHARDTTRALLAEILGERAVRPETLRTMRTLTGVRFWTSKPVRDAVRAAVEKFEARLGGPR